MRLLHFLPILNTRRARYDSTRYPEHETRRIAISMKQRCGMTAVIILTIMPFMSCTYISTSLIYKAPPDAIIDTAYIPDAAVITRNEGERVVIGLFCKGDSTLVVLFHGNSGTITQTLRAASASYRKPFTLTRKKLLSWEDPLGRPLRPKWPRGIWDGA